MIRSVARWVVPAGVARALRARRAARARGEFTLAGPDWPEATGPEAGWNEMAERLVERWPAFLAACEGTAPLDAAHEAASPIPRNIAFHNTYMTFGYVLARAAHGRERLSVLDWGGGLGHYFVLARALMPDLELDYHVKDLPEVCQRGRTLLPEVTFHDDDTACATQRFDLVVASGAVHCVSDWKAVVACLAVATEGHLFITRLPTLTHTPSIAVSQDAAAHGFASDLPEWFVNRDEFLEHTASLGMELLREFYVDESLDVGAALETPDVRGFLFRPRGRIHGLTC